MPELETALYILLIGAAGLLVLAWILSAVRSFHSFARELRHLNTEIRRTHGREKQRFKRMRRRLWIAWLTFRYNG